MCVEQPPPTPHPHASHGYLIFHFFFVPLFCKLHLSKALAREKTWVTVSMRHTSQPNSVPNVAACEITVHPIRHSPSDVRTEQTPSIPFTNTFFGSVATCPFWMTAVKEDCDWAGAAPFPGLPVPLADRGCTPGPVLLLFSLLSSRCSGLLNAYISKQVDLNASQPYQIYCYLGYIFHTRLSNTTPKNRKQLSANQNFNKIPTINNQ